MKKVVPVPATTADDLCGLVRLDGDSCRYLIWPASGRYECVKLDAKMKQLRDKAVANRQATATGVNCSGPPDFIRTGKR